MDKFPVQLAHVIGRCLQKDPAKKPDGKQREICRQKSLGPRIFHRRARLSLSQKGLRYLPWVVAGAIAAASLLFTLRLGRAPTEAPEMRLQVATPPTTDPVSMAISPDGRQIVFSAIFERHPVLWLRPLDSTSAHPLAGTNSGTFPFWAPDSRSVGFFADRQLKRIDLASGTVQALARVEAGRGGAWNSDGTIIFQPTPLPTPLLRISASGGEPVELRVSGRFPQFLPDGQHFLYYALGPPAVRGIYVGDLDNSEPRRLLDAEGAAVYAGSGHLLFVREGTVFAQGLNLSRLKLQGDAVPWPNTLPLMGRFTARHCRHPREALLSIERARRVPCDSWSGSMGRVRRWPE